MHVQKVRNIKTWLSIRSYLQVGPTFEHKLVLKNSVYVQIPSQLADFFFDFYFYREEVHNGQWIQLSQPLSLQPSYSSASFRWSYLK